MKKQGLNVEFIGNNENLLRIDSEVIVYFDNKSNCLKYSNHSKKLKMQEIKLNGCSQNDLQEVLRVIT